MRDLSITVLIMDDEPHILDWLVEYLERQRYKVVMTVNVDQAIDALEKGKYRLVILDLNIPASGDVEELLAQKGDPYEQYRGLYVAEYARTKGHRGKQVVVYSVHDTGDVSNVCERIGVEYLVKGRPREFKRELDNILGYDPTRDRA